MVTIIMKVGDLEIEMSRANGKVHLAVRGRIFGNETDATDDEVRGLAANLIRYVGDGKENKNE